MSTTPTTGQPSSSLARAPPAVDVIVTAASGAGVARAAYRGGALVGHNSGEQRPPPAIPVDFIDWPFLDDDPCYETHLRTVARERPHYAVAPDADGRPLDRVLELADDLDRYAETVIVVPKDVPATEIPERFRVGIPAQEQFGGVPRPMWEYQQLDRPVHILGGSPNKRAKLGNYVEVGSWDSTSICRASNWGDLWDGDRWDETGANWYTRIERSVNALVRGLNPTLGADFFRERRRHVVLPDCSGAWTDEIRAEPPTRDELCIRESEEPPFPGRAYFERPDGLTYREWYDRDRDDEWTPRC